MQFLVQEVRCLKINELAIFNLSANLKKYTKYTIFLAN
jgi:hypothetical protein